MDVKEFCERICEEIVDVLDRKGLSNLKASVQNITKNNGVLNHAIVFMNPERNISPTIYLDYYYDRYMNGMLFTDIVEQVADTYIHSLPDADFEVTRIVDFENVKNQIIYALVNYGTNAEQLKGMPHKQVEDLAIIYKILLSEDAQYGDIATVTINNQIFEKYDISLEELHELAQKNTNQLLPVQVRHMAEILGEYAAPFVEDVDMYVVSNEKQIYGAGCILQSDVMDTLAAKLGNYFYVIPSSVHEVIAIPDNGESDVALLNAMIAEVNDTQLDATEILSYRGYMVDATAHKIFLAEKKEEYIKEKELQNQKQKKLQEEEKQQKPTGPKL